MRLRTMVLALALALLAAFASPASAQTTTPPDVKPGITPLLFEHDGANTTGYRLCQDTLTACMQVAPTRVGTTNTWTFILPATASSGLHTYRLIAFGADGDSEPSVAASFRVRVVPSQPGPLRVAAG